MWTARSSNMFDLMLQLKSMENVFSCYPFGYEHHVVFKNDEAEIEEVLNQLKEKGHGTIQLEKIQPTIEDCFMALMHG